MHSVTYHLHARPVQRQSARRHITRITAAYRRHYRFTDGRAVRARAEVLGAFAAHMVATRRALLARAEA